MDPSGLDSCLLFLRLSSCQTLPQITLAPLQTALLVLVSLLQVSQELAFSSQDSAPKVLWLPEKPAFFQNQN